MAPEPAKVSVVLEWETVLEGKPSRGSACLAALRREVATMPACETIVCFDAGAASEADVRRTIGPAWPGPLTVAPAPTGLDYYGQKNHGFTLTSGEVVVFLDSDLVPEPGWLSNLVAPLDDRRRSCVVGRTHLETSTRYERAVALFWIFDERDASSHVRPTRRLVSNNVAFRRALFKYLPFPDHPTFRGQCSELAAMLHTRRIPMHEQPAARASHPAPDGARRFLERALHAGSDHAYYDALEGASGISRCLHNFRTDLHNVRARVARRAPCIGADRADRLAGYALGTTYYATKAFSYALTARRRP